MKADAKKMKSINKALLRQCFSPDVQMTAHELADKTGLSVVTVNGLLKEMVAENEVLTGIARISTGGRPSARYCYNSMYRCAVIIYGFQKKRSSHVKMVVADWFGRVALEKTAVFEEIREDSFEHLIAPAFQMFSSIQVIAFGLPAEEKDGKIHISDFPMLMGDTFLKHYEATFQVPVLFENDINAAVNGYFHNRAEVVTEGAVAGIYIPQTFSPGCGLVINGSVFTGKLNFAGELGAMPIGVDWQAMNYENEEELTDAVAKVVAGLSCILAPEEIVIYAECLQTGSGQKIKQKAEQLLNYAFEVAVAVSAAFEEDYEQGMIKTALEYLQKEG